MQKVIAVCETYKLYNENDGRGDNGREGGRCGDGKDINMCRTPGHNHAWEDCLNNRWSRNYEGPSKRGCDGDNTSRSRSRLLPWRGARHRDKDLDRSRDRDRGRDSIQNRNKDRDRQAMKVCEAMAAKARRVRTKHNLIKHTILLVPT